MYFHGLGYAEIRRRVNLDALNISRDNIRQNYFDKIKVATHTLNYLLFDKKIANIVLDGKMSTP